MSAHVTDMPAEVRERIRNLAVLAKHQSARSVQYKNWAMEAERAGMIGAANRWAKESAHYRRDAKWYIRWAMRTKDGRYA